MGNKFASGKHSISECDRCGFRFRLKLLREIVIKTKKTNILVCGQCWDPDHPQLLLGSFPVDDPQALRNPRPDRSYVTSGTGLDGYPSIGSRDFQWGWAPVGGGNSAVSNTPNALAATGYIGTVTVSVT
jgi:hypothetical protein